MDHIIPVVDPEKGFISWDDVVSRLFCEIDGLQVLCKACHDSKTKDERELRNRASCKEWRLENLPYDLVSKARRRCELNGLPFDLDRDWVTDRYTGKCELTGIPFEQDIRQGPFVCSLDRINSADGYTKNNCRFILFSLNMLKGVGSDDTMYTIAQKLIKERARRCK